MRVRNNPATRALTLMDPWLGTDAGAANAKTSLSSVRVADHLGRRRHDAEQADDANDSKSQRDFGQRAANELSDRQGCLVRSSVKARQQVLPVEAGQRHHGANSTILSNSRRP